MENLEDIKVNIVNNNMRGEHNNCLDFFKGIACLLIILVHVPFPGFFGEIIGALSRFAVPFFFMISGYFYIIRIGKLYQKRCRKKS